METRIWLLLSGLVALGAVIVGLLALAGGRGVFTRPGPVALAVPDLGLESGNTSATTRTFADASKDASGLGQPQPLSAAPLREFDADSAMDDIRSLAAFGPRIGGSAAERQAADYLSDRLEAIGLTPRIEEFPLPDGTTSRNIIVRVEGSSAGVLVLGAHYDTKPPSPGANDNASGCAVLLQLAEILHEDPAQITVEFIFFGAEETIDTNPDHHHYGSRYRVSRMTQAEKSACAGMISVDMVGYGPKFHSRTMGKGPRTLSNALLAYARSSGVPLTYLHDPGESGWSDHEPYELAGIPAAWIEWRDDPAYHTVGDTAGRISRAHIATTGRLVIGFVRSL